MKEQKKYLNHLLAELRFLKNSKKNLEQELRILVNENYAIKKSLSFKVGSAITYPFRLVYNLLNPKPKENPIKASIDYVIYSNGVLEVAGWGFSSSKLSIEFVLNGVSLDTIYPSLYRRDVESIVDENHPNCGFVHTMRTSKLQADSVCSYFIDEKDNEVMIEAIIFPSTENMSLNSQYQIFLQQNPFPSLGDSKNELEEFKYNPLISIVVPVYNTEPKLLGACINSVINQYYTNWQLCLYDDTSNSVETVNFLKSWVNKDSRIKIKLGRMNQNISLASNHAINMCSGEFIGLLDHDDELTPNALFEVVKVLNENPELDFIYSDEDKIELDGSFSDPHYKSDFNMEALHCQNYICHFSVIRKSLGDSIGWFRKGFEGSQDFDLFLRLTNKTKAIHHIPKVLYHWRKVEGSTANDVHEKGYAIEASRKALIDLYKDKNVTVNNGLFPNSFRVKHKLANEPLVSIVVPFRNELSLLKTCVDGVLNNTSYKNIELLLVDNQSSDLELLDYLKKLPSLNKKVTVLEFNQNFNYSKLNNWAVNQTQGDYILFLNNDIEIIEPNWLSSMVEHLIKENTAAVGARLLYPDRSTQHVGVVVDEKTAMHINKGLKPSEQSYFERTNYIQNVSACTAACLLVKKKAFLEVGGFDEELFKIAYNDVDLCLKLREKGYLITYTPYAELIHHESKTRGLDDQGEKLERFTQELRNYQEKWGGKYKDGDPYFNPNLLPNSEKIMLNIK